MLTLRHQNILSARLQKLVGKFLDLLNIAGKTYIWRDLRGKNLGLNIQNKKALKHFCKTSLTKKYHVPASLCRRATLRIVYVIQGRKNHDSHRRDRIWRDFLHWIFRYFLQILGGSSY